MYNNHRSNSRSNFYNSRRRTPSSYHNHSHSSNTPRCDSDETKIQPRSNDHGPEPFVVNIKEATIENNNFRSTLWTGHHLQLTLMCINVCDEIGLELHSDVDQFLRVEQGEGLVIMGDTKDNMCYQEKVCKGFAIFIPACKWHNIINTGSMPLKLYSIYAPPHHPHGTLHKTKHDAEEHHGY